MSPVNRYFFSALLAIVSVTRALQVTPGSTCASVCLDQGSGNPLDAAASSTQVSDIVCSDVEYFSDPKGIRFRNCIECLQKSTKVEGNENDVWWYLYNLRYATDVCLFSFPNATSNISSPCDTEYNCGQLRTALTAGDLQSGTDAEFEYCEADNKAFNDVNVQNCAQCLQATNNEAYLSNFLVALQAGCQQRPAAGALLGLSGSLFQKAAVNITAPPATETTAPPAVSVTTMSIGTIVGIAVGAALLFLGGCALFLMYWRRQKRYDNNDPGLPKYIAPNGGTSAITTPCHLPPYYTHDYKQQATDKESRGSGGSGASDYTSNAEYYDRIAEEMKIRRPSGASLQVPGSPPSNSALPIHPAYIPRTTMGRGSRANSPNPDLPSPPLTRSNKPDSYALQAYLNAAEDTAILTIPPPPSSNPPSARSVPPPPPSNPPSSRYIGMASPPLSNPPSARSVPPPPSGPPSARSIPMASPPPPSIRSNYSAYTYQSAKSPPPPPPSGGKAPSLILPSVPRIRVPKKYVPPKINIQEATPLAGQGEVEMDISLPISYPEERFRDGRELRRSPDSFQDRVVEQQVERPVFRGYRELPIQSGKSLLYG